MEKKKQLQTSEQPEWKGKKVKAAAITGDTFSQRAAVSFVTNKSTNQPTTAVHCRLFGGFVKSLEIALMLMSWNIKHFKRETVEKVKQKTNDKRILSHFFPRNQIISHQTVSSPFWSSGMYWQSRGYSVAVPRSKPIVRPALICIRSASRCNRFMATIAIGCQ